jgi:hypothetical protein
MVAEILFAGGRLDALLPIGTVSEVTTGGTFDASYADCSIATQDRTGGGEARFYTASSNVLSATTVVSGESLYCHFVFYKASGSSDTNQDMIVIYDSSGFPWFRIATGGSSNTLVAQYNSGSGASPVWTSLHAQITFSTVTLLTFDIKVTLGSPHSYEFAIDGSLQASGTFTQASFTNAAKAQLTAIHNSTLSHFSEVIFSRDINLVGARLKTLRASGAGTNTGWSGAYTDVNEAVGSDATLQSAGSAGLKSTHAMGDVTTPGGSTLQTIFHWMRARNGGGAPANLKSVLRLSGVDYSTGNLSGITGSFTPVGARYDQNPDTAAAWADAGWNAAEAGYESAT